MGTWGGKAALSLDDSVWISKMGGGFCELEVEKIFVIYSEFNFLKMGKEVEG